MGQVAGEVDTVDFGRFGYILNRGWNTSTRLQRHKCLISKELRLGARLAPRSVGTRV